MKTPNHKNVNNQQEIKQLLEKHLARKLSSAETNELFDRLRTVHDPEELDVFLRNHWNLNRFADATTDLSWGEVLDYNNRRIDLEREHNRRIRIRRMWQWSIAASVLIFISIAWLNWNTDPAHITYTTDFGETKNIVLNDGTSVILNANSSLTWNNNWKEDAARFVGLHGEAFFDVSHVDYSTNLGSGTEEDKKRMPFQVYTSDVVINVLGTAFNVADRRGETQVYLENGSIKLGLLDSLIDKNNKKAIVRNDGADRVSSASKSVMMLPGETVEYSAQSQDLKKINPENAGSLTEWKEGSLVYHDIDFAQMLEHLEDIYGKQFIVRDSTLLETKVSFGLPYKDWKTVKSLMELSLQIELTPKENDQIFIEKR